VSVLSIPAVLLRSYPYSETSQVLRFYTESHGVLGTMARGVRKSGGRRGGGLSTFTDGILDVHYRENRDLQTFRDFSVTRSRRGLALDPLRLAGASVLAELILRHAESQGDPDLYSLLGTGLDAMEAEETALLLPALLAHLWPLIVALGFAPVTDTCVECGRPLEEVEMARFDFAAGGLRCPTCQGEVAGPRLGPLARQQLQSLMRGVIPGDLTRPAVHLRLAGDFITYHISGGGPLRSMAVLAGLSPENHA
jgi:DNA repair protein RecO (recombination protein O)